MLKEVEINRKGTTEHIDSEKRNIGLPLAPWKASKKHA